MLVSFTEAPTCPRLHPHLCSSGPVKHKHRESGIWDGKERRGTLDELTNLITSEYTVSPLAFADDWRRCSKQCVLKKPQGFPWVLCLQSLQSAWLTPRPSDSARAMDLCILCSTSANQYIVTEALWTETRAFCLYKSSKSGHSTGTYWSFESCFPLLVAVKSNTSSFLARGLMVPLLPQVLLVLPIISHSLGLLFGPWLLWQGRWGPWGNEVTPGSGVESGGWNRTTALPTPLSQGRFVSKQAEQRRHGETGDRVPSILDPSITCL